MDGFFLLLAVLSSQHPATGLGSVLATSLVALLLPLICAILGAFYLHADSLNGLTFGNDFLIHAN